MQSELHGLLPAAREAADWRAREQAVTWLEESFKRAKSITKELRGQLSLVEVIICAAAATAAAFIAIALLPSPATSATAIGGAAANAT